MIDLSPFPQSVRSALRLLWGAGVLGLAVFTAGALVGYGSPPPDVKALFVCLILVSAVLCGLRAVLVREERVAWTVFAVGMASWAAGYGHYFLVVEDLASAPYPSLSDALWIVYYVATIVGLLTLMRSRQQYFRRSVWVDVSVGGLAIAAVAAALLVDPILVATGGSVKAVATNLAYPLFNVLIISIVLAACAKSGWRPGRGWILLGGVFAAQLVADVIYLFQAASGTYQFGTLLDAVYPGFMLAVAVAAWQKPAVTRGTERRGWGSLAVTAGFAVIALGLTTYDHWHPVNDVAMVLVTLTLLAAFVRTAMTVGDMRSAARGRDLLERNELILNTAGEGICGLDADGVITFANPQAAALTGFAAVELVGRNLHSTVHHTRPDGSPYPLAECPVTRSLQDARVHHADDQMFWRKDGSSFPVGFTSTPVLAGDRVTGAVVVFRDITKRMATEAALRASELRTRQILQSAHDAFVAMDASGRIIDWNPTAEAIFGWSREEAEGRDLSDTIIPEAHRDAHRRGLQHFLATGEGPLLSRRLEFSALRRDGHEFEVETTISSLLTEDGWTFNAFARDITERNATQEQLRRQRQQLLEAQSVGGFGTWDYDVVANTTEWSDELCRIYGVEHRDRPRTIEQAIEPTHPEDVALVAAALQGSLDDGPPVRMEYRIVRPDGSVRTVEACGEAVTDEQGVVRRMLGTVQDITDRHAVQQAKDEFISVVSHELRTPLTSIRGSLGLLESGVLGPLAEQGQRMVEIAVQNTDRLVRLINDILDIERLDAGENDMQPVSCAAGELIEQACSAVAALAEAAQVTVTTHVEPVDLQADRDRVVQTLTNLIGNAVKFSSAGQVIRVSCSRRDEEVLFEVSDQGRGIPPEHLESIFRRFQQVDVSDSRQKGGTGLGLAICRSIVEQHGGRIWAHSAPGEGATFSFVLPSPTAHGHDPRPARSARPGGPTVLVCDDDPCVLEVVEAMLEARGFVVVTSNSGEQALELAVAEPPDAILLDLLDWLRLHERLSSVPMVIYTARELDESDRERLRLGATTEFLTKGRITPEHFEQRVMALLGRLTPTDRQESGSEPEAHPFGR